MSPVLDAQAVDQGLQPLRCQMSRPAYRPTLGSYRSVHSSSTPRAPSHPAGSGLYWFCLHQYPFTCISPYEPVAGSCGLCASGRHVDSRNTTLSKVAISSTGQPTRRARRTASGQRQSCAGTVGGGATSTVVGTSAGVTMSNLTYSGCGSVVVVVSVTIVVVGAGWSATAAPQAVSPMIRNGIRRVLMFRMKCPSVGGWGCARLVDAYASRSVV